MSDIPNTIRCANGISLRPQVKNWRGTFLVGCVSLSQSLGHRSKIVWSKCPTVLTVMRAYHQQKCIRIDFGQRAGNTVEILSCNFPTIYVQWNRYTSFSVSDETIIKALINTGSILSCFMVRNSF